MEPRKPRRPPWIDDCQYDFYWPQFSEPGDEPEITVLLGENRYDLEDWKSMRKHARWLLRASKWAEAKCAKKPAGKKRRRT